MRNLNQTLLNAADATSNQVTASLDASQLYRISFQAIFSDAACTGSIVLQASNEIENPTNWADLVTVSVSAGGVVFVPSTELSYQWVQLAYTANAGAGTITVNVNAQGF